MSNPANTTNATIYKLFLFTFLSGILTYGFALTNFTISIDNEIPILSSYGLDLGRWGSNLVLYHLFGGHLQYFSLVLSLFLFSVAAVRISKIFKFHGVAAYCFCGLFITFPQLSYQVVFGMMAVIASLGILLSTFFVELFIKGFEIKSLPKKIALFSAAALTLMFTLSMYQAFILVPVTLYTILFFQGTFEDTFKISSEIKRALLFGAVVLISGLLYYISVKIICPIQDGGYIDSFVSGNSENPLSNFISLCKRHLSGAIYYGEKLYVLVSVLIVLLSINLFLDKKHFIYRFLVLLFLIISPFLLSYFITNGYHPPRLFLTTNIVFAFVLVFTMNRFKIISFPATSIAIILICLLNIYFVTKLFSSVNKIYKHDKKIAEKMDYTIQSKYPNFSTTEKYVYFFGSFPYEYHQKFRLQDAEIFGGSFFSWDNGNNYRIINFFREADVAEYKMVDTKERFDTIKDSIAKMPIWPDPESVKMIDNTVIIKLGNDKGSPLYFE